MARKIIRKIAEYIAVSIGAWVGFHFSIPAWLDLFRS